MNENMQQPFMQPYSLAMGVDQLIAILTPEHRERLLERLSSPTYQSELGLYVDYLLRGILPVISVDDVNPAAWEKVRIQTAAVTTFMNQLKLHGEHFANGTHKQTFPFCYPAKPEEPEVEPTKEQVAESAGKPKDAPKNGPSTATL